jgi:glycosyltransferase involved in cell wall biosynthesis
VQTLSRLGHQLQVLTSNYRLPPMGVAGEKGVFRELHLYPEAPDANSDSLLGHSYRATYAHERYNAESLEYRVRRFKPDVVYVWNVNGLSKSLFFRLQSRGMHIVYDLHSDWLLPESFQRDPWYCWWRTNRSVSSKVYQLLMRSIGRARRIMGMLPIDEAQKLNLQGSYVVSEWLRERLVSGDIAQAAQLPVIYPAVDHQKLSPKTSYAKRHHFIWAGRLGEAKGAAIAVDAVGILKERGIEVSLDLFAMGEPSERKAKREYIEAAGLIEQVTMQGIRPGELSEYYQHYDALLYTTRAGEPFSMTVLEAMHSKLPCIVADTGGNQEILESDSRALLFEAGNAEALADAIVRFMQREDGGRMLVENSIEGLQAEHTMDTFCQQIEPLLAAGK